jgi:hypothetical protein
MDEPRHAPFRRVKHLQQRHTHTRLSTSSMKLALSDAPPWSEQTKSDACKWSYGYHQGLTKLSSVHKAAREGCVRCKLLSTGIEKYTFRPYRPHRTTEAHLSEYEPDPGLNVSVYNDPEMPLQVTVQYVGMSSKSGSLPMELLFYTHPGSSTIANESTPMSSAYCSQTSHVTFRTFSQQAMSLPTLPPKLPLVLSAPKLLYQKRCTHDADKAPLR